MGLKQRCHSMGAGLTFDSRLSDSLQKLPLSCPSIQVLASGAVFTLGEPQELSPGPARGADGLLEMGSGPFGQELQGPRVRSKGAHNPPPLGPARSFHQGPSL